MQLVPIWRIKNNCRINLFAPVIMGVVNCTPDSFFDGGRHGSPEAALQHALDLAAQGALILDIGGESSRPGSFPVDVQTESARVLPVVQGVHAVFQEKAHETKREAQAVARASVPRVFPDGSGGGDAARSLNFVTADACVPGIGFEAVISIDTTKATIAAAALECGADIVNDVSACRADPELLDVLREFRPGYVLMHAQGRPETMQVEPVYADVVDEVSRFLEERMNWLVRSGLPEACVVLDPGIGFGKRLEHNLELLRNVERLAQFGRPVLVGISNKSFWKGLLGLELEERGTVSQVATALLAAKGVLIHRVHDVLATARTLRVEQALHGEGRD